MSVKKIPQRTCIACRQMKEKAELIRVVRTKTGEVFLDKTFKSDGRGAYVCRCEECVLKAQKSKAFERAFKTETNTALYLELLSEVRP